MTMAENRLSKNPAIKAAVAGAILLLSAPSHAATCPGVVQGSLSHDARLTAALSKKSGVSAQPIRFYRTGAWWIYVLSHDGDPGYLISQGPALGNGKNFLWGGVALPDEYDDVISDVKHHVPGIPAPLLACFGHEVTGRPWSARR